MQNEKLRILKMLEDGKITSAEAAQLLQSVEMGGAVPAGHSTPPPVPPPAPGGYTSPSPAPSSYTPLPPRASAYDDPARSNAPGGAHSRTSGSSMDELGRKFESFAKDMEPKLKSFTETVAEKITQGADMLSKAFSADPKPPAPHHHGTQHTAPRPAPAPRAAMTAPGGMKELNVEMPVAAGFNELALSGINGELRIKGYNGDKITARITYKAKRANADIDLMKLGNKYQLNYESDDFERVSIDAYVPERAFGVIKIDGINAQMDISSLSANDLRISNANGNVRLSHIAATNLTAENSAGRFVVSNISAESAKLENVNGSVEADELDIAKLSLTNYNGPMSLLMSTFARHDEYMWNVETGNAKLNVNLPTLPNLGYHIKAHAAMGEIRLGLTGMQFLINDPTLVEARSTQFDTAAKRVKMTVETSNAPLVIN